MPTVSDSAGNNRLWGPGQVPQGPGTASVKGNWTSSAPAGSESVGFNPATWAVAPQLVGRILEDSGWGRAGEGRLVGSSAPQGHFCPRKASSPRSPVCLGLWTGTDPSGLAGWGRRCAGGGGGGRKGSTSAHAQSPPTPWGESHRGPGSYLQAVWVPVAALGE